MRHKSNICPKRRELRLVEGKGKEVAEMDETDSEDDYDKEALLDVGHQLLCLIHRNCHAPALLIFPK